jgi:putative hydrolase of the HAD superfamily
MGGDAGSRGVIVFDMDDLLILNVHWYWAGWQMFKDVMTRIGFAKYEDEVVATLNRFDEEGVKRHGFRKERFGEAMGETYDHFCQLEKTEPDAETRAALVDIGLSVYRHKPILYPRAKEVLGELRGAGFALYCVTKGDEDVQWKKLADSGIREFFDDVHFVPLSKRAALEAIIAAHPEHPKSSFWFVGNSPKDDMGPAIELGINGVLIYQWTWDFDEKVLDMGAGVTRLERLADLPAHMGVRRPENI